MTRHTAKEETILTLARDRRLAHSVLFRHRHPQETPEFHGEIVKLWHSPEPKVVTEAFRGGAKSTLAEEFVLIKAAFQEAKNVLIVGATEPRAMERLEAIKHESETNEDLAEIFGDLRGPVWQGHKAELRNGVLLQAVGVGQSLRGLKYHQWRPDLCLIDDIEDDESVKNAEARAERLSWLYKTLLPALSRRPIVRMIGNRLDAEAVIVKVANDPEWKAQRFPIRYRDVQTSEWRATWPAMFDLDWIEKSRSAYARVGQLAAWEQEYMCEAEIPIHEKAFKPDQMKVVPRVRTWEPTMAIYDPARSVNAQSATTGKAVCSWIGRKLVVWDGFARQVMPDFIIDDIFKTDDDYRPVVIAVEEDGLNEWLKQPIRAEILKRQHALPNLRAIRAPRGKFDFIKGLQPFFAGGDVEFAFDNPELRAQFLSFPRPPIDFPNALAYALSLRPGQPIYEDFTQENVVEDMPRSKQLPCWLALNATGSLVTGVLLQWGDRLRIFADWVEEGEPAQAVPRLLRAAKLEAGGSLRYVAPPLHTDRWQNVGLAAAVNRIPAELRAGARPEAGRGTVRQLLRSRIQGGPAIEVSPEARWTLNGFAAGYARAVARGGLVADHAEEGVYRTLMEGIESLIGLGATEAVGEAEEDADLRYRSSNDGRRYVTILPEGR